MDNDRAGLQLAIDADNVQDFESVILIPERAIKEQGYIQAFTLKDSAGAKHEYHAMAQMAYFQFQDDELTLVETSQPIEVVFRNERIAMEAGMALCRKEDGSFLAIVHQLQNRKKLLEAGYRYCTRWVRLDI